MVFKATFNNISVTLYIVVVSFYCWRKPEYLEKTTDLSQSCECRILLMRGVLNTTLCDQVCQWLVAGRWFSQGTPVSFTDKTKCHNITEIKLKVTLNSIILTPSLCSTVVFVMKRKFKQWSTIPPISIKQKKVKTVMVINSTNVNKTNKISSNHSMI